MRTEGPAFDRAILLVVILLTTIPFLHKAFHIDDPYYIEIAKNILRKPLQPFDGAVALVDYDYTVFANLGRTPNTFEGMSHPPLLPYFIALIFLLTGGISEVPQHLAQLVFTMTAAFSAYWLTGRFTITPRAVTLFLITSPVFILCSNNIMTDIPMLALSLSALALFISGIDHNQTRKLYLSGLLVGFAILMRYVAVYLIPLFALYELLQQKKVSKSWKSLCVAIAVFGLWCLNNLYYYGEVHLVASSKYYAKFYEDYSFHWVPTLQRDAGDLSGIGGVSAFAFLFLFLLFASVRKVILYLASLATSLFLVVLHPVTSDLTVYSSQETTWLVLFVSIGIFFILCTIASGLCPESADRSDPRQRADNVFLVIWFTGLAAASMLLLPFGTVRYMLPTYLPAILILSRQPGKCRSSEGICRKAAAATIGLTLLLGLCLAYADNQYAGAYRACARSLKQSYPGSRIWFVGDWGFRFYMEQEGYRYLLSTDQSPESGDMIVRPRIAGLHSMSPLVQQRSILLESVPANCDFPIRVMSFEARAGFYSHGFGYLPFAVSKAPLEVFDVFRVQ